MAKTGQVVDSGTQVEDVGPATQVKVETGRGLTVSTIAVSQSASLPVAVEAPPALAEVYASGFVVRTVPGMHTVAVQLDAQQLAEQQRVRKLNDAIRRSTQG